MSSTALFGLAQSGVTARLWSRDNNLPPESFDESIGYPGVWDVRGTTPDEQSIGFQNVPPGPTRVWFRAPGYVDQKWDGVMPDDGAKEIRLAKAPVSLRRLTGISNHRFIASDGTPVYGKMADAFLLYKKWLDGENITSQLEQWRDLGFNMLRVMGMFESLGGFDPKAYGARYYDAMPAFFHACEAFGLYVYFVCCAATQGILHSDDEVSWHVQHCVAQAKAVPNVLISWVNEQGQHNNSVNRERLNLDCDMSGLLWDSGSFGVDEPCSPPFGTHAVFHSRGDFPASCKDMNTLDHPNYVHSGLDVAIDEPGIRYGDEGKGDGHDQPSRAGECAGSAWPALAWTFHSMQGEKAELLSGNTLDCARAAVNAMRGF